MIVKDRIVSNSTDNECADTSIRPKILDEYIGQDSVKAPLKIFIQAAKERNQALDHVLLFGPPGLGKTTLAYIIAREMQSNLHVTSGPALEKAGDLASLLARMSTQDILFIDEIHRLSPAIEEVLYPAMEDYQLDLMIGEGPSARSIKVQLNPFTLIGATTRAGALTSPLRDRFGIIQRLNFYNWQELSQILVKAAKKLGVQLTEDGATQIAKRSRGTPRIAHRLLRRARDFAQVKSNGVVDCKTADQALLLLEVDDAGFDSLDRKLLSTIVNTFNGGPVGVENLAASLGEAKDTIEDVIEPYLLQKGYIRRTARGRVATSLTYSYFKSSKGKFTAS